MRISTPAPLVSQSSGVSNRARDFISTYGDDLTRRDACHMVGERAYLMTTDQAQAAKAWHALSVILMDELSVCDIPKFRDLLSAIRRATIAGKQP